MSAVTGRASAGYAPERKHPSRRKAISRALLIASLLFLLAGIAVTVWESMEDAALKSWSGTVGSGDTAVEIAPQHSSWITVANTAVDHPLAQATETLGNSFYLHHAPDGSWSSLGTPFIDMRTSASSTHVLAYGHRAGYTSLVFTDLADDWRQERLDAVGNATVWDQDGKRRVYRPLMSMSVDMSYSKIQKFDLTGDELREWLRELEFEATAKTADAGTLISRAKGVLTLSTCSSPVPGGRYRTLTVFVR